MNKRPKYSLEEEEQIIDFVKNHEILFNVRNKNYRDSEAKNRLWLKLGKQLDKDSETVKKKWGTMRDYFIRNKDKKSTGSAATITKRDESLMFLLDQSILKKPTLSNITSSASVSSMSSEQMISIDGFMNSEFVNDDDMTPMAENLEATTADGDRSCASSVPVFELLREFRNRKQPNPIDFLSQKPPAPKDHLQQFCDSIECTLRTFPPLSIAKVKLQISQIVGKEEIACAERNAFTNETAEFADANTRP